MSLNRDTDQKTEQYRKLFIGGLTLKTTEEMLGDFYGKWGNLVDCVVMKDHKTGRSRGFGFVTYDNPEAVDEAQKSRPHTIDGRNVEAKRAMPRDESSKPEAHLTVKRLFVGNLKNDLKDRDLREYFGDYGTVEDAEIMTWKESGESRGFGFVTFSDYDAVDKCVLYAPHKIGNNNVNVKKALSKDQVNAQKRVYDLPPPRREMDRERERYPHRGNDSRSYFDRYDDRPMMHSRYGDVRDDPSSYRYGYGGMADFGYYGSGYGASSSASGPMRSSDYHDGPRSRNMGPSSFSGGGGPRPYSRSNRGGRR